MASRGPSSSSRRPTSGRRDARATARPSGSGTATTYTSEGTGTRFTTRALILLAVAVVLIASYTASVHAWWQQRSEIAALEAQNRAAKDDIAQLKDEQRRWSDAAYIRQQARERFGWVMPGEVGYRVIGADGELQGRSSTLDEPAVQPRQHWIERLWGSVGEAGKEPGATSVEESEDKAPALEPDQ